MKTEEEIRERICFVESIISKMRESDENRPEFEAMVVALRWVVEEPTAMTMASPANIWR